MADAGPEAPVTPRSGVDPLSSVEREALTKIRQHEAEVSSLRDDFASLRERTVAQKRKISVSELRRVTEEADRVEALLAVPREVLARDALSKVSQWPSADLFQARAVLSAVDACEEATRYAGKLVYVDNNPLGSGPLAGSGPDSLCAALANLLHSWSLLGKAELEARKFTNLIVGHVDLGIESRANAVRPVADALLDKTVELYKEFASKSLAAEGDVDSTLPADDVVGVAVFGDKLQALLAQQQVKDALSSLGVDVPSLDMLPPSVAKPTDEAADAPSVAPARSEPTLPAEEDPLLRTTPSALHEGVVRSPDDSAVMWHAVHVGDEETIKALIEKGICDARQRDASGHSVFWHAIAFNHLGIAKMMLDAYPPHTDSGVEAAEVHPRKGDTLLHLMCQSQNFGADMAYLFKKVAAAMPANLFPKVNSVGVTFLQLAAASLNFWVLTFLLRNFKAQAKALVCMPNNAPLRSMSQVVPQPVRPSFTTPEKFPLHFRVAEMLQPDDAGIVPYADVAFDVGPEGGVGRFLAHRIVVVAQSPVLLEALEKLPLTELPRERIRAAVIRVDPRISQEVWRSALQFMYTGIINCAYGDNVEKVVELLRACVLYKLPRPLLDAAQCYLHPLLPGSPPHIALQVFSICSGSSVSEDAELRPSREAATYILMRSAHRLLDSMEPSEVCQILEQMVRATEHAVFNPPAHAGAEEKQQLQAPVSQGVAHDILSQSISNSMYIQATKQSPAGSPLGSDGCLAPQADMKSYGRVPLGSGSNASALGPVSAAGGAPAMPLGTAAFGFGGPPLGSGQLAGGLLGGCQAGAAPLGTAAFGFGALGTVGTGSLASGSSSGGWR